MSNSVGKPRTVSVELDFPIENAGQAVSRLELRRPQVADSIDIQRKGGTPGEMELLLVSRLTGLPVEALHTLDIEDYAKVQAAMRRLAPGFG
jgi:hypothetical protein